MNRDAAIKIYTGSTSRDFAQEICKYLKTLPALPITC